jgi:hypothetical protein
MSEAISGFAASRMSRSLSSGAHSRDLLAHAGDKLRNATKRARSLFNAIVLRWIWMVD